jgi:hypothetical protein
VQELLERELGITVPAGVTIQVQQGISLTVHLVQVVQSQPGVSTKTKLSEADVKQEL